MIGYLISRHLFFAAAEQASGIRGGATGGDDSAEESDDILEDDDEDVFEDDDGAMDEEDFGEANFIGRLQQDWRKTPIITKTFFRVHIHMMPYTVAAVGTNRSIKKSGCHDLKNLPQFMGKPANSDTNWGIHRSLEPRVNI